MVRRRAFVRLVPLALLAPFGGCSFSSRVNDAAEQIRAADAILTDDPSARAPEAPDAWCNPPNVRGTDACFDGAQYFVRVTGPFLSLDGWYLSRTAHDAAPSPGDVDEPAAGVRRVDLDRGWSLYAMDD